MSQAPRKASSTRDDFLSRESTGQSIDSGGQDTRQHSTTYGSFHTKAGLNYQKLMFLSCFFSIF